MFRTRHQPMLTLLAELRAPHLPGETPLERRARRDAARDMAAESWSWL